MQAWHRAFGKIRHGGIPVIACLQGAVVGGGATVRTAKIISAPRMVEMMLTGREVQERLGEFVNKTAYKVQLSG